MMVAEPNPPTSVEPDPARSALSEWYRTIHNERLVIQLRPRDLLSDDLRTGDIDLLGDPTKYVDLVHTARAASRKWGSAIAIHNLDRKFQLVFRSDENDVGILVEIWKRIELSLTEKGTQSSRMCIKWDSIAHYRTFTGNVCQMRPDVAAAVYLTHLFHKNKDLNSVQVQDRLMHYIGALEKAHTGTMSSELQEALNGARSSALALEQVNAIGIGHLRSLGISIHQVTKPRRRRYEKFIARLIYGSSRASDETGRPLPETIAVVGPDGAGKTTLCQRLSSADDCAYLRFKHVFRRTKLYRRLRRRWTRQTQTLAQNIFDERMGIVVVLIAMRHYAARLIEASEGLRSQNAARRIIVDRYFWDFMVRVRQLDVQPRSRRFFRTLSRIVPAPDMLLVIDPPNEAIASRRSELSASAIEVLRYAHSEGMVYSRVRHAAVLSADLDEDGLHAMAERLALET